VYLEKAFDGSGCIPEQRFPNAKRLGGTSLMFLCHSMPSQTEVDLISHVLAEVVTEQALTKH
jgi:dTDP-4-amino-4,6-dideoxygalactose transaminase